MCSSKRASVGGLKCNKAYIIDIKYHFMYNPRKNLLYMHKGLKLKNKTLKQKQTEILLI